jgi:hypothetical protein
MSWYPAVAKGEVLPGRETRLAASDPIVEGRGCGAALSRF